MELNQITSNVHVKMMIQGVAVHHTTMTILVPVILPVPTTVPVHVILLVHVIVPVRAVTNL